MNFEPRITGRMTGLTFSVTFKSNITLARKLSWKKGGLKKIEDNDIERKKETK